jgi:S-methylmethionine-dependent homocysteine/selenocysteine methylase
MSYSAIHDKLQRRELVILDGAIGTEILRRNVTWADHQLAQRPDFVREIHEDYIRAGAEVISTNSFQLCRRALFNHFRDEAHRRHVGAQDLEHRADQLLAASVRLAREARDRAGGDRPVAVAAAITTLEWCFRPDLAPAADQARSEYAEIFRVVKEAGADLVLLETVNSIAEARVALEVCNQVGLPCWVAFVCDQRGRLFTGETLAAAVSALEPLGAGAVLVNCAPPADITAGMEQLAACARLPIGAYAHIGRFDPPEWMFTDEYPPRTYLDVAAGWKKAGATIIGGCCGTTPEHIALLAELREDGPRGPGPRSGRKTGL